MYAQLLHKLEDMSRTVAVWTSASVIIIFTGVFFATNSNFGYHLQQIYAGKEESIKLPVFLGMILAVFVGYLLARKKQLAVVGATIAMIATAVIYAWCELWYLDPLSPYLLALAGPALFHLASVELDRAAARQEASVRSEEPQSVECHKVPPEGVNEEPEMAVGTA